MAMHGEPEPSLGSYRVGVDVVLTPERKRELLDAMRDLRDASYLGGMRTVGVAGDFLAAREESIWLRIRSLLGAADANV